MLRFLSVDGFSVPIDVYAILIHKILFILHHGRSRIYLGEMLSCEIEFPIEDDHLLYKDISDRMAEAPDILDRELHIPFLPDEAAACIEYA